MYVVTGGMGFIGANVVKALNDRGIDDILVVDDTERRENIADCRIADYLDKKSFLETVTSGQFGNALSAIFHHGACSDTMEQDRAFMMENNYEYTKTLLSYCQANTVPLIYASSASVYGAGPVYQVALENEDPLNPYAESKFLFDQDVRGALPQSTCQIVGLRYFNVYGPREQHKERMTSVVFQFFYQYRDKGRIALFCGSGEYGDGEQRRDFVSVHDVVATNMFFLDHPNVSGIFNVGTGRSRSFNDVAVSVINSLRRAEGNQPLTLKECCAQDVIQYIDFPDGLREQYQNFTEADIGPLGNAGYTRPFLTLEEGVEEYTQRLLGKADGVSMPSDRDD